MEIAETAPSGEPGKNPSLAEGVKEASIHKQAIAMLRKLAERPTLDKRYMLSVPDDSYYQDLLVRGRQHPGLCMTMGGNVSEEKLVPLLYLLARKIVTTENTPFVEKIQRAPDASLLYKQMLLYFYSSAGHLAQPGILDETIRNGHTLESIEAEIGDVLKLKPPAVDQTTMTRHLCKDDNPWQIPRAF